MNTCRSVNGGFALPLVLITLALLTALAMGLTKMVSANSLFLQERKTAWEEEKQVRDTLNLLVLNLLTGDYTETSVKTEDLEIPLNSQPIEINDATVKVQNWSGLYGLSLLGTSDVEQVMRQFFDGKTAAEIGAQLSDWVDEDDRRQFRGYERADYSSEGLPQRPRNAPLRSIDELLELPAVSAEMMSGDERRPGLADLFLAGGEDNFDLGTAPDELLGPVLGLDANQEREVLAARRRQDWAEVIFRVGDSHIAFNNHPPFHKGYKYRLDFESNRSVASRVHIELSPYDPDSLFKVIEWQVPWNRYE